MCGFFPALAGRCVLLLCVHVWIFTLLAPPVQAQVDTSRPSPDTTVEQGDSLIVPRNRVIDTAAADTAVTEEVPGTPALSVTNDSLRAVARALVAIEGLRREFHSKQGRLNDSARESDDLHAQFRAAAAQAIEAAGVSRELYVDVVHAARKDPQLRTRLRSIIVEMQEPQ